MTKFNAMYMHVWTQWLRDGMPLASRTYIRQYVKRNPALLDFMYDD